MEKRKLEETKSLASIWREKLDWYLQEATDEEYDEEEVRAIRSVLKMIEGEELDESYYNAEKGLERFKSTLKVRMRIADEMRRLQAGEVSLTDYLDDEELT